MTLRVHFPALARTALAVTDGARVVRPGTSPELQRLVGWSLAALRAHAARCGWRVEERREVRA